MAPARGTPPAQRSAVDMPAATSDEQRGYQPRRPTETLLYRIVSEHLDDFLNEARDNYARPLPRYVEQELRSFLKCGILEHGFVVAECRTCGERLLLCFLRPASHGPAQTSSSSSSYSSSWRGLATLPADADADDLTLTPTTRR